MVILSALLASVYRRCRIDVLGVVEVVVLILYD